MCHIRSTTFKIMFFDGNVNQYFLNCKSARLLWPVKLKTGVVFRFSLNRNKETHGAFNLTLSVK